MKPPVTYQGSKARFAHQIVDHLPRGATRYYDLCCGSGAVSLALLEVGIPAEHIVMVDSGPWGHFWRAVGNGTFDLDYFKARVAAIPRDKDEIKKFVRALAKAPVNPETMIYDFLFVQAGSYQGRAVSIEGDRWIAKKSFRGWHQPMVPMPEKIIDRVEPVVRAMRGATGLVQDIQEVQPEPGSCVYIDPPYASVTGYGSDLQQDIVGIANRWPHVPVYVSERVALNDQAVHLIDTRKSKTDEWLSPFHQDRNV